MKEGERLLRDFVQGIVTDMEADIDDLCTYSEMEIDEYIENAVDTCVTWTDENWAIARDWNGRTEYLEDYGYEDLDSRIMAYAYQIICMEVREELDNMGFYEMMEDRLAELEGEEM